MLIRTTDGWASQRTLRSLLFVVSALVVVLVVILINVTTDIICENDRARDFIESIQGIPLEGWKVAVGATVTFALLAVLTLRRSHPSWGPGRQLLASGTDLVLCFTLAALLGFAFRGIFFLAMVNGLRYLSGRGQKTAMLAICVLAYLFADNELISVFTPVFTLNDYLDYYSESRRLLYYGTRNLLLALDQILFIVYLGLEVQTWIAETSKVRELNKRLVRTSQDLAVANVKLEEYARRAEEAARFKARNRMAAEIHDILGHTMTGIEMGLKACLEIFAKDPARVQVQLTKIAEMARSGLEEVRRSVHALDAEPTNATTIVTSLNQLAAGFRDGIGRKVLFHVVGEPTPLSPVHEEVLYRVAQESMTNAIAHGDAQSIEISLEFESEKANLTVADDGSGQKGFHEGFGIRNMKERLHSVGGSLVVSAREPGFEVVATIPLKRQENLQP